MFEPNCDMPWEVYLDWLQDQGNDDLRYISFNSFTGDYHRVSYNYGGSDVHGHYHCIGTDYFNDGSGYSTDNLSQGEGCHLGGEGFGCGVY